MTHQNRDAAIAAGEEGMRIVKANNKIWHDLMLAKIGTLRNFLGTFEDLRVTLLNEGWAAPRHHNAWGSLARAAKARGYLIGTGQYVPMETIKSHGRKTEVLQTPDFEEGWSAPSFETQ